MHAWFLQVHHLPRSVRLAGETDQLRHDLGVHRACLCAVWVKNIDLVPLAVRASQVKLNNYDTRVAPYVVCGLNILTYYPSMAPQVKLNNYDMSLAPGRTYRYYTGTPSVAQHISLCAPIFLV